MGAMPKGGMPRAACRCVHDGAARTARCAGTLPVAATRSTHDDDGFISTHDHDGFISRAISLTLCETIDCDYPRTEDWRYSLFTVTVRLCAVRL